MSEAIPWRKHALRVVAVALGVALYQQLVRGEIEPIIIAVAAIGYVLVAEGVRRYTDS